MDCLTACSGFWTRRAFNIARSAACSRTRARALAREGVQLALESGAELILAVGGGSVIDTCKAIAHGAANPGTDIWEFWKRRAPLTRSMPVGVVLTIPAAGSETSDSAVLTNAEAGEKRGLNTPFNRPAFAILRPPARPRRSRCIRSRAA